MRPAAVRIDSSSSSRVVAPSARAEIVLVATRIGSTPGRPSAQRATAFTILFTSTSSKSPFRFLTRMLRLDSIPSTVEARLGGLSARFGTSVMVCSASSSLCIFSVSVSTDGSESATCCSPKYPPALARNFFGP